MTNLLKQLAGYVGSKIEGEIRQPSLGTKLGLGVCALMGIGAILAIIFHEESPSPLLEAAIYMGLFLGVPSFIVLPVLIRDNKPEEKSPNQAKA